MDDDYFILPATPTVFERDTPERSGLLDAHGVPLYRSAQPETIGFLSGAIECRGRKGGRRNSGGGRRMPRGGRRSGRGRRSRR